MARRPDIALSWAARGGVLGVPELSAPRPVLQNTKFQLDSSRVQADGGPPTESGGQGSIETLSSTRTLQVLQAYFASRGTPPWNKKDASR